VEIRIPLTEKQTEFDKSVDTYLATLYGGAKGGGKSYGLRNIQLKRRFQYPKSKGAIFRKTYGELEANHIRPLFEQFPGLKTYYNESKKLLTLPDPIFSTLEFCHLASEKDLYLYQGREFHDLGIEEAGQWSETAFQRLRGSNRSSNPNIRPRILLTANPGGPGHKWLKRLFIDREFNQFEKPGDYNFIQALIYDNPAVMEANPEYLDQLRAEPNELLRKAYLEGDWEISAGTFFSEFRKSIHVVEPFAIPNHWQRIIGLDWGWNHPMSIIWAAVDEEGNVYVYREWNERRKYTEEASQYILSHKDDYKKAGFVWAGHDCWVTKNPESKDANPTIAQQFQKYGVILKRANIDRVQGATQIREYLRHGKDLDPRLYFFDTCPKTINCLTRLIHDERNPEDVLKEDFVEGDPDSGDDLYDALRNVIMSRPRLAMQPKPSRGSDRRYFRRNRDETSEVTWRTV
jgi:phage terminase large subunit